MDMKKMLEALDGVERAEGTTKSTVASNGSMKALLESLDRVGTEEAVTESEDTYVGINTETGDFESGLSKDEVMMSGRFTHMLPDDTTYFDPDTAEELVGAPDEEMKAMGWEKVPTNEGGMKDAVTDMQERLHDFAREIQKGMHSYDSVVDELNDMFDEVVDMGDPIVMNAFKVLRTLEPEDFGEGEGGGPNRASTVSQDAMDIIDGGDDSDYDHLPKIGEAADEELEETTEEELEEAIMVSAEGDEAAELLAILKNAGMPEPAMPAMPEPEMDMQDEYSNSPDEQEMDLDAVIASGDDMHREKGQFAAAADGDNPMKAFEGKLQAMLDEMLAEDEETTEEVVAEETAEETEEVVAEETAEADDLGLSRFLKMAGI